MIPEERLSSQPMPAALFNPWAMDDLASLHWGPVALQDTSQGLNVQVWRADAVGDEIRLSAPKSPEFLWYQHSAGLHQVSLAFDQNARPVVAFVDSEGGAFLRWFDPVPNDIVNMDLAALGAETPRVTLDDSRPFNIDDSDVILAYVREGALRYRQQRDRFEEEYTPPIGEGGSSASVERLRHVSMNAGLRMQFVVDEVAP